MKGREHVRRERALDKAPVHGGHLEVLRDDGASGGGAEADDDLRLDGGDLALEPLVAGVDLALRRGLVQPALACSSPGGLPLEVLYRVGDVDMVAVHARGLERPVEKPAGRADEGQAFAVLLVAGLLAHQHDPCVRIAGAEYRLRRVRPQRAILAALRVAAQLFQAPGHRALESPA
jgi:hypothetical protein